MTIFGGNKVNAAELKGFFIGQNGTPISTGVSFYGADELELYP